MKTKTEKDELIDQFLINEEGFPSCDFTQQTVAHIRKSRQTVPLSFPIPLALALAACLVAAFFLPIFINYGDNIVKWNSYGKIYNRYYYIFRIQEITKLFDECGLELVSHKHDCGNEVFILRA